MRLKSIQTKVLFLFLLLTLVLVLIMSVMVRQGFIKQFNAYKNNLADALNDNIVLALEAHYQEAGNWNELIENNRLWSRLLVESATNIQQNAWPKEKQKDRKPPKRRHEKRLRPLPNFALIDAEKNPVVGEIRHPLPAYFHKAINNNSEVVGYLLVLKHNKASIKEDQKFNRSIQVFLWTLAVVMLLITVLASWPIAKYFTKPIKSINVATQKAAAGDFSVRTHIARKDELGQLGQNFNVLTSTLQSNAEVQKKMMADISHELRTPVAVLQAEIEAIQDGIHDADEKSLGLLHQQVCALGRLIQDLHQLSVADLGSMQYQMQAVDIGAIIVETMASHRMSAQNKSIDLHLEKVNLKKGATVLGDGVRLQQMLNNLLSNAVAYTDAGGRIEIRLNDDETAGDYVIEIQDSEPGLLPHEMAQMFDRLYRKEGSRNKKSGGSGLGLAIVKNIVAAHNGSITASYSGLGGVCMTVRVPKHV